MSDAKTAIIILTIGLLVAVLLIWRSGLRVFAQAIAYAEGYGVAGAIPTVRNNPGDLKLSGGEITTFRTAAEGWAALYRQLQIIIDGRSLFYTLDMTIAEMAQTWTATEVSAWASNVLAYLRSHGYPAATTYTRLSEILT